MSLYRLRFSPDPWSKSVSVLIDLEDHWPRQRFCGFETDGAIRFENIPQGQTPAGPTLRIPEENAQEIFDQLWRAGYRPHNGKDSEGVYEAQREHITDLRNIVATMERLVTPTKAYDLRPLTDKEREEIERQFNAMQSVRNY